MDRKPSEKESERPSERDDEMTWDGTMIMIGWERVDTPIPLVHRCVD